MAGCPHSDVRHCPLYVAAHHGGFGCDDGRLGEETCAVSRGMDYHDELGRIMVALPGLKERVEWDEAKGRMRSQIARNMRLNGVH